MKQGLNQQVDKNNSCFIFIEDVTTTMRQTFDLTIGKNERYTSSWSTAFNVYRRTFIERGTSEWKTNDRDIAQWILNYENALRQILINQYMGLQELNQVY